jgi:hypothetical protein
MRPESSPVIPTVYEGTSVAPVHILMNRLLIAAGVILSACGGTDATGPGGGNSNTPTRTISLTPGASLSGFFGNYMVGVPQVTVRDASGNPLAGFAVTFAASGGGQVTGASTATDADGHAQPISWRLGGTGSQALTVSGLGATALSIPATATAPPASTFHIDVRYAPGTIPTAAQKAAFDAAADRWSHLILQGGPPVTVVELDQGCGDLRGETVDGLVISAELVAIDGKGKVLGSAGPCLLRDVGYLPLQGLMRFDTADLATLETNGQLDEVILHEMGHVLGFGTIWEFNPGSGFTPNMFLLRAAGDPVFTGTAAISALLGTSGGLGFSGAGVPVEATGGAGTAYAHWRESSFGGELMTGWLNGGINPLSAVTVDQFRDLGYVVNDALADGITLAAAIQAAGSPVALVEGTLEMPLVLIDRRGRAVGRIARVLR